MAKQGLMIATEVAQYLNCSISTVRRLVMNSKIPHFRLGKLVRFRRSDIDAWLTHQREGDHPADPTSRHLPLTHPDQLSLFDPETGRSSPNLS